MAKLERLTALHASGALTAEEFSAAKAKLLA
jgi:Short C-terminal domain